MRKTLFAIYLVLSVIVPVFVMFGAFGYVFVLGLHVSFFPLMVGVLFPAVFALWVAVLRMQKNFPKEWWKGVAMIAVFLFHFFFLLFQNGGGSVLLSVVQYGIVMMASLFIAAAFTTATYRPVADEAITRTARRWLMGALILLPALFIAYLSMVTFAELLISLDHWFVGYIAFAVVTSAYTHVVEMREYYKHI